MAKHIIVVDDDALLRRSVAFGLEQAGYRVSTAGSAEDGQALAQRDAPDLVLLDIGLPGMDGLEALQGFRDVGAPVIFITARRRELDEVLALQMGGDDYITKPFDFDVLTAHVKAVLRRFEQVETVEATREGPIVAGDIAIDPGAHTVTIGGRTVELPPREFDLLHTLALQSGRVIPTDDLLARVWGAEYQGETQVVYVHIRWLREKIEDDPHRPTRVVSIRGVGYKLEPRGP